MYMLAICVRVNSCLYVFPTMCVCVCVCVCVYAYMHVTESERERARAWHVCKYLTSNVPIQQMRNLPAKAWLCPSVLLRHFESTCRVEP